MKKQFIFFAVTVLSLFLTSCITLHNGNFFNTTQVNTNNFRYVKQNAEGSSTVTYFLGLGGGRKAALIADAKKRLLRSNPLKDNQALVNININFKYTSIFLGILILL